MFQTLILASPWRFPQLLVSEFSKLPGDADAQAGGARWAYGGGGDTPSRLLERSLSFNVNIVPPPLLHPSDGSCLLSSEPKIPSSEMLLPWKGFCAVISLSSSFGFIITAAVVSKNNLS